MSVDKPGEWPLTHEEVEKWANEQAWKFAKTSPDNPHSYTLKRNQDPRMFEMIVLHIREFGWDSVWWSKAYTMYEAAGHHMWSMGAPLECTILINRKALDQVREDELTGKGK